MWKYYALLSALFASLTAIFAKIGIKDVNSDLATAIRTSIIVLLTWGIVLFCGVEDKIKYGHENETSKGCMSMNMVR